MKNTLIYLIVLLLLSCNSSINQEKKFDNPLKEILVGQIKYSIYDKSFATNVSTDGSHLDTTDGYYLKIMLGITNNSKEAIKFDTSMFRLTNNAGHSYPFSYKMDEVQQYIDTSLNEKSIPANNSKKGYIIFNVPSIRTYNLELNNGSWAKEKTSVEINPVD